MFPLQLKLKFVNQEFVIEMLFCPRSAPEFEDVKEFISEELILVIRS